MPSSKAYALGVAVSIITTAGAWYLYTKGLAKETAPQTAKQAGEITQLQR